MNHPEQSRAQLLLNDLGVSGDIPLDRVLRDFDEILLETPKAHLTARTIGGKPRGRGFTITDPRGDPYLTRTVVEEFADGGAIYLQRIHRSDGDREFHDHPSDFRTFIVSGRYIEHRPEGEPVEFRAGDWNMGKAEKLHRLELPDGPVLTIVYRGPKRREWGFRAAAPDAPWVHHVQYLDAKFGVGGWTKEYE